MGSLPSDLVELSTAHSALSQATTVKEVKELRDKAESARYYAQRARLGLWKQNQCAEFKLNCERKAGRLLIEMGVAPGRPGKKKRSHRATILAELGINKSQSARWQQEARVPDDLLRHYIASAKAEGKEITAQGLIRLARQASVAAMNRANNGARSKRRPGFEPVLAVTGPDCVAVTFMAIVDDLLNHHELLVENLREFCEQECVHTRLVQRRIVARILKESRDWLTTLRETLELAHAGCKCGPLKNGRSEHV
jgi:hypothetical protein